MPLRLPILPRPRDWRHLLGYVKSWLALVVAAIVVDVAIAATMSHLEGAGHAVPLSLPVQIGNWVMWAAFAPAIIALVRAMTAGAWPWTRRIPASIALAAAVALTHATLEITVVMPHAALHDGAMRGAFFSYHLWHGLLTFWVLYAVAALIETDRTAHERELREAHLREEVGEAQLQMLRMQLQPHFLFNTLNSVSALVDDDPAAGQRMLARLSEFLRLTLAQAARAEHTLGEELVLLRLYVEIERTRFADRLRVVIEVSAEAEGCIVPSLLLQPLVENAIRHGVQPAIAGGTLLVRAWRDGSRLAVTVEDDGVGLPAGFTPEAATGIGLANTRRRLRERYGDAHEFRIEPRAGGGTMVILRLPWVTAPDAALAAAAVPAAPLGAPHADARAGAGA